MITKVQIELARENWIRASINLSFKLITPYFIEINGIKKEIFAFLPDYGSPNGVLICLTSAPEFKTNNEIISYAKENKLYYSFINIESCQTDDENYFKELLEDWIKYEDATQKNCHPGERSRWR